MGASATLVGLGFGLAAALRLGHGPASPAALIDADFEHRRFTHGGQVYGDEAAFLAAIGGARSGGTITIAPKLVGPELVSDPAFEAGIEGWANGGTFESVGTLSWDVTGKRLKIDVPSRSGGTVQHRCGVPVAAEPGKAYQYALRSAQALGAGGWNVGLHPANLFGGQSLPAVNTPIGEGELMQGYAGANASTMYLGKSTNLGAATVTEYWDDASVREVTPLEGHDHTRLAVLIDARTPPSAGAAVLFQADTNSERFRLRVEWDAAGHLRVITTVQGTEQADLDLGSVPPGTAFGLQLSATANSVKASLNGQALVFDTSAQHPAISHIRLGRSFTGEAWGGEIHRVRLFPATLSDAGMVDPGLAFMIYGDSTANGDGTGVTLRWYDALIAGYSPARSYTEAAQGGENSGQMLARVLADTDHRQWTTIFMDRPNTGETSTEWLANLKTAVGHLQTSRWLVVPPVQNSPGGPPNTSAAAIGEVQAALLGDPFFAGHTFDAGQQASYIAALDTDEVRTDGLHFSNSGQAIQAAAIRAFLDARGW